MNFLRIFYSPADVFDQLKQKGSPWWLPLLALFIITGLGTHVVVSLVGPENILRTAVKDIAAVQKLPPEQQQKMYEATSQPGRRAFQVAAAGLGSLFSVFVVAGLFAALLSMLDTRPDFAALAGSVGYCFWAFNLVTFTISLLTLLTMTDRAEADVRYLSMTNVGAFLNRQETSAAVFSLARSVDLVSIGAVALMSLAFSRNSSKVSYQRALLIVSGLWLVWITAQAGMAAVLKGFTG